MKAKPDCIPCIIKFALHTARRVSQDEWLQRKVVHEAMDFLGSLPFERTPAEIAFDCLDRVKKTLGLSDPYKEYKKGLFHQLTGVRNSLEKLLAPKDRRLHNAVRIAAFGNRVDSYVAPDFSADEFLASVSEPEPLLELDDFAALEDDLTHSTTLLYITDGVAELVTDRLLLREISAPDRRIDIVVGKGAVLDKATEEDALAIGLDSFGQIIDIGTEALGVPIALSTAEFKEKFNSADLVIAKGEPNYVTLESAGRKIYFLLAPRCDVIANHLGVKRGALVLLKI